MSVRITMVLPLALALLVPFDAIARPKNEHNVIIPQSMQVGSTQLKPGSYKVEWDGTGPSLQVSFLKNGKTVATTEGKMVEQDKPSPYTEVVCDTAGKTARLEEINFRGKKEMLVITSDHASMH